MQARMPVTVSTSGVCVCASLLTPCGHVCLALSLCMCATGDVPPGSFVRAYLVFRDPSLKETVQRCAKHQSEEKGALDAWFVSTLALCFSPVCVVVHLHFVLLLVAYYRKSH